MGRNTFIGLCHISNYNDWFIGIDWMESYSNLIKFYCFNANLNMAMNIHVTVRFLQLKKEFPQLKKDEAVLEASNKMMLPILYTVLTTICAFLSLVFSGIKPIIDFGWMMTLGLIISILVTFLLLPSLLNIFSLDNETNIKDTEKSILHLH